VADRNQYSGAVSVGFGPKGNPICATTAEGFQRGDPVIGTSMPSACPSLGWVIK
jgi:hypothetical protein